MHWPTQNISSPQVHTRFASDESLPTPPPIRLLDERPCEGGEGFTEARFPAYDNAVVHGGAGEVFALEWFEFEHNIWAQKSPAVCRAFRV